MTDIDATLVRRLIRTQFPQWAELPIAPIENGGWDNRIFRLGDSMSVRLPSALHYVAQVEKEHRWLPVLAAAAVADPSSPWPWGSRRRLSLALVDLWLARRQTGADDCLQDLCRFAVDLARFLVALRGIDARNGPVAGTHNFHRGGSLMVYDSETRQSIGVAADEVALASVTEVWDSALATAWQGPPVWVHGDVAESNLLVQNGRLNAVIDFGCAGVGDPSCDLVRQVIRDILEDHSRAGQWNE